jgi:DNA-binding NarL/FixJ family response regulator
MNNGEIRVLVVDDHELLRSGIKVLFKRASEIEVVGEASTGGQGMKLVSDLLPDVVVLDVKLPDENGIDLAREITKKYPQVKILVISADLLKHIIDQAISAGAQGVMLKESVYTELVDAVRAIHDNKRHFCSRVKEIIAIDWAGRLQTDKGASLSALSTREREIVKHISEGKSIKEIAALVNRSTKTVDANRRNIMKKLTIDSVPELVKFAIAEGLTTLE